VPAGDKRRAGYIRRDVVLGKRALSCNEFPCSAWFPPKLTIEHVRVRSDFFEKVAFLFAGSSLGQISGLFSRI
jgi:hypothetical protein